MKAAVFEDVKKINYKEDYLKPVFGSNDVLIKVHYCGICGSDVSNFKYKIYQVPLIMGHELTGEVIEVGKNVLNIKIGDRVCGINVLLDIKQRNLRGLGIFQNGGFAEYASAPYDFVFKIPNHLSLKEAVMIESFANIFRGLKLSNIQDNQNIMIIGGGNIGLCFLNTLLIERSPNYILVIEPHQFLREKAIKMGASEAFPPSNAKIKKFIKQNGEPTYIFDCVGNDKTLLMGVQAIKRGGTILLEGMQKGNVLFPVFLINSKEICLQGSLGHSKQDILEAMNFVSKKKVDLNQFLSKVVHLKDIQKTFESYLQPGERTFIKTIVEMK